MILPIVRYGHPVLRQRGAEISDVTEAIHQLSADMLETMYAAHGIGLAAQQVGQPLLLTVIDVRDSERPSQLFLGVKEVPLDSMMPLILLNPTITRREGDETAGGEGCLSFPKISADVPRVDTVHVSAMLLNGQPIQFTATGLLARAVQHELDHLNGVLFIDRMTPDARKPIEEAIQEMEKETKAALKKNRRGSRTRATP